MDRPRKACVYCGVVGKLTADHIPPKNLFSIPRPQLITVPACAPCNEGASKDDEYFRLVVTVRADVGDHPEAQKVLPTVVRSLEYQKNKGFTQGFLKSFTQVELNTRSGIYVGTAPGYHVALPRIHAVARRIAVGLYYHELGRPLPTAFQAVAYSEEALRDLPDAVADETRRICTVLTQRPPKMVGNVFRYWHATTTDNPDAVFWLLSFFGHVNFLCLTGPRADVVNAMQLRGSL